MAKKSERRGLVEMGISVMVAFGASAVTKVVVSSVVEL